MKLYLVLVFFIFFILAGCDKEAFLAQKPTLAMSVPSTQEDLRAMLDHESRLNGHDGNGCTPQLGESGSDNIYLRDQDYTSIFPLQSQNYYIWAASPYTRLDILDWDFPYRNVLTVNTVLDVLDRSDFKNTLEGRVLRGEALFHRAHMFFQLASVFAPIYYQGSNANSRGIPLRLSAGVSEQLRYATVEEVYEHVERELLEAVDLLPDRPLIKTRPSKSAVYALLSRLYLYLGHYQDALNFAELCLDIDDTLIDYNEVNATVAFPFSSTGNHNNPEVIFASNMISSNSQSFPTRQLYARVDSLLYKSYADNDLRKVVFFLNANPGHRFKGSYSGDTRYFAGLATDEVYLNKAEALIRLGDVTKGLSTIDEVLKSRWRVGAAYVPVMAVNEEQAIDLVMQERRKELLFRGVRWLDLKRMMAEGKPVEIVRVVNGEKFTLGNGDPRWVWPIPPNVEGFM